MKRLLINSKEHLLLRSRTYELSTTDGSHPFAGVPTSGPPGMPPAALLVEFLHSPMAALQVEDTVITVTSLSGDWDRIEAGLFATLGRMTGLDIERLH